jgi:hypothetical protein
MGLMELVVQIQEVELLLRVVVVDNQEDLWSDKTTDRTKEIEIKIIS